MATNVGIEAVREVKNDESEHAILYRTDSPVRVELGESAGNVVFSESEYFLIVDVNVSQDQILADMGLDTDEFSEEELDGLMDSMGIPAGINEGAVALSNEDGEVGHVVIREDGADLDGTLDAFTEQYL